MDEDQERAYSEGFKAFGDDLRESDCPYDKGCKHRTAWIDGYQQADDEHTELVTCGLLGIPM
tara:strand:- start:47148 stop:47333 length:186 start_codon:yes stop_codon:yes gene_type:complete